MRFPESARLHAVDNAQDRDARPEGEPWKPLTSNDDDDGDQTTDAEPDL